jgi:heme iron utilization protein
MEQAERARPVLQLLQNEKNGVLSTLSNKLDGWPYGSLMPFALTEHGEPLVLMSTLAEHTQNVLNDPRVSLFVHDEAGTRENPQAAARATLICLAEALAGHEANAARANYLARFPQSAQLLQMGDFKLFKLKVERVRYIGGFGEMYWVGHNDFAAAAMREES